MVHPNYETWIGTHQLLLASDEGQPRNNNLRVFNRLKSSHSQVYDMKNTDNIVNEGQLRNNNTRVLNRLKSSYSRGYNVKNTINVVNQGQPRNNNIGVLNRLKLSYSKKYSMKNTLLSTIDRNFVSNSKKGQVSFGNVVNIINFFLFKSRFLVKILPCMLIFLH